MTNGVAIRGMTQRRGRDDTERGRSLDGALPRGMTGKRERDDTEKREG
ncbi:MAG: hypothetical protein NC218_08850 [Acetobacter sp.]|nr:hypothetical protein [Acetobacter sp.]